MDVTMAEAKNPILGQDFLTWLWFKSEKSGWLFKLPDGGEVNVYLEQKISVRGGEGDDAETATVSGPHAQFAEARLGVKSGKRVDRALIRFEQDGETWTVTVKADDFTLNTLRTPKTETRDEEGDDPDAKVLEKLYLLEKCGGFFDALYTQFLNTRLSQGWTGELSDFADWLREGV
uniref:Uncharacterized protein n=1 Tax=Desulfovibrio sp. U5L TaxID=596152 RepID=I2Q3R1_9BACT